MGPRAKCTWSYENPLLCTEVGKKPFRGHPVQAHKHNFTTRMLNNVLDFLMVVLVSDSKCRGAMSRGAMNRGH